MYSSAILILVMNTLAISYLNTFIRMSCTGDPTRVIMFGLYSILGSWPKRRITSDKLVGMHYCVPNLLNMVSSVLHAGLE